MPNQNVWHQNSLDSRMAWVKTFCEHWAEHAFGLRVHHSRNLSLNAAMHIGSNVRSKVCQVSSYLFPIQVRKVRHWWYHLARRPTICGKRVMQLQVSTYWSYCMSFMPTNSYYLWMCKHICLRPRQWCTDCAPEKRDPPRQRQCPLLSAFCQRWPAVSHSKWSRSDENNVTVILGFGKCKEMDINRTLTRYGIKALGFHHQNR